jgi:hypothetical protein
MGWGVFAAAFAGIAALAWSRGQPRIPAIDGLPARVTQAERGPYTSRDDRLDLFVGPGTGARLADGRWTPEEIAAAAARIPGAARVVVTDAGRIEAEGDAFAALAGALDGIADLTWVQDR